MEWGFHAAILVNKTCFGTFVHRYLQKVSTSNNKQKTLGVQVAIWSHGIGYWDHVLGFAETLSQLLEF